MRKDRDWLDYAQLASSVGQNIQLSGINSKLEQLQNLEAQRLNAEMAAGAFRKNIFELQENLDLAATFQSPRNRLSWLMALEWRFRRLKLYQAMTYEDKDRLDALASKYQNLLSETKAQLKPEEVKDIELAFHYKVTLWILQDIAAYGKELHAQKKREAKLHRLKESRPFVRRLMNVVIFISVVGALIGFFSMIMVAYYTNTEGPGNSGEEDFWGFTGMLAAALSLPAIIALGLLSKTQAGQEALKLDKKISALEWATLGTSSQDMSPDQDNLSLWEEFINGDPDLKGLDIKDFQRVGEIILKRKEFVAHVLGDSQEPS